MKAFWIFLLAGPLLAHDLYLLPERFRVEPGASFLLSVCVGDSFPVSEGPADPRRLIGARFSDGAEIDGWQIVGASTHAVVRVNSKGSVYAGVGTKPRRIELPAEKFAKYLAEEGLNHVAQWRKENGEADKQASELYSKFAKTLLVSGVPSDGWKAVFGYPIEIVPERDPSALRPGELLPILLLYDGKPLAGAQVEAAWEGGSKVAGRTDRNGRLKVPLTTTGKWRLHAVTMRRSTQPDTADWESYWASLTFEVTGDAR
ncbi:MAG: DUF4198 domain-containing protein [Bryobacteraceae bacterium]